MLGTRLGADNGSCPFYYKKENEYKNGNPHILHFGILIFALENAFLVKCISRIPKLYSKHDFFFFQNILTTLWNTFSLLISNTRFPQTNSAAYKAKQSFLGILEIIGGGTSSVKIHYELLRRYLKKKKEKEKKKEEALWA